MSIINDNFMLHVNTAKTLYKKFAEPMPVIDYHCHISPELIAKDYKFKSITELMLGGDHYKWRMMRSNGIDEKYMTGDADDYDKFLAFAKSLGSAVLIISESQIIDCDCFYVRLQACRKHQIPIRCSNYNRFCKGELFGKIKYRA